MAVPSKQLEKEDTLLLLFLALSGSKTQHKIAGITRVEKLMYLLQEETGFSGKRQDKFDFKAWKFGPFSQEIYQSIDLLSSLTLVDVEERELANYVDYMERDELVETDQEEPRVEKVFSLTARGKKVAEALQKTISPKDWEELTKLTHKFERVPLTSLIQYVYHKYPETTSKSVLNHLKPH